MTEEQQRLLQRARNFFGQSPMGLHELGVVVSMHGRKDCCSPIREFLWIVSADGPPKIASGRVRSEEVQWLPQPGIGDRGFVR